MRGKLTIFFLGLIALSGYVAAPFITAWSIREAIRNGDAAYLEAKVDWPRVKQSLKTSMTAYAFGASEANAQAARSSALSPDSSPVSSNAPRPGFWQRLKATYGQRVITTMIDTMVTPTGLSRLFTYRQGYNEKVRGIPDERDAFPLHERLRRNWQRVIRAEFLSPTRFAMEMRDKVIEGRIYAGILQMRGLQWQLVHLEVKRDQRAGRLITASIPASPSLWSRLRQGAIASAR